MMKKKVFALVLALVMVLALVAPVAAIVLPLLKKKGFLNRQSFFMRFSTVVLAGRLRQKILAAMKLYQRRMTGCMFFAC